MIVGRRLIPSGKLTYLCGNHHAVLMAKSNYFYGYVLCRKQLNDHRESKKNIMKFISQPGWWFGTFFIFPYTGNNHIFQRGWNHQPDIISYHAWQYLVIVFFNSYGLCDYPLVISQHVMTGIKAELDMVGEGKTRRMGGVVRVVKGWKLRGSHSPKVT